MENNFIIKNLLDKEEGTRLEFKTSASNAAIAKIVASMINTEGGDVLIGVNGLKEIIGLDVSPSQLSKLQRHIINYIKPQAPVSFKEIIFKNKLLFLISTWEGSKKPYQYKGKIYVRENEQTKISDRYNINLLIEDRKNADFHWERRTVLAATIDDLAEDELALTFLEYKKIDNKPLIEDKEDFLLNTGLMKNGSLTNASIVLFAKYPLKYIPQSSIRITLYPSTEVGNKIVGDRIYKENLFENIQNALRYLEIIYGETIEVSDNMRSKKLNYPKLAIREALLNAIVHRDYNSVNSFVQVNVFSDRTEISNYGRLPDGITIADLRRKHSSILRNPDIAQMCFTRKYIEMLGSGTLRMINECRSNGFKTPKWKEDDKTISVVFEGVKHTNLKKEAREGVNEGVSEGVKYFNFEELSDGVNESINKVYNVLDTYPEINASEVAQRIGKGLSTTERYLRILKDKEIIVFIGSPKTGGYVLKKHLK